MDIASFVGFASGIGLIIVALVIGGNVSGFWDMPSVLMVGGGTIAASLVNFPLKQFLVVLENNNGCLTQLSVEGLPLCRLSLP